MIFSYLQSILLLSSTFRTPVIVANSAGCGKDLPKAQTPPGGASHQTDFQQSDGTPRTYLIHIPSNYDKNTPVPLIFSFHGRHKNSSEQEALSQFSNEDWNPNGIAVYPQGINVSNIASLLVTFKFQCRPLKYLRMNGKVTQTAVESTT
jgi:poly(3-hydroxybutyrate) depolymerase